MSCYSFLAHSAWTISLFKVDQPLIQFLWLWHDLAKAKEIYDRLIDYEFVCMINCLPLFFLFPFPPSLFTSPRTSQSLGLKTERAFQKQPTISHNRKGGLKKAEQRFVVSPGLGFKVPREVVLHPF